jgi:hypothetical protein
VLCISSIDHLSLSYPFTYPDGESEGLSRDRGPSTQRRTKARHDPAALRAVQEALGQEGSQRSSRPRRGDPPPSYAEGSEEEIVEEEEERTESDGGDEEDETYEQSPEPPRRHVSVF